MRTTPFAFAAIAILSACSVNSDDADPWFSGGKADGETDQCAFAPTEIEDLWARVCPDRPSYALGELVTLTYQVENRGAADHELEVFPNCGFDFAFGVRGAGRVFAFPGDRGECVPTMTTIKIPAGGRYEAVATWDQRIFFGPSDTFAMPGPQVRDGEYFVVANLLTDHHEPGVIAKPTVFTIGNGGGVAEVCPSGPPPRPMAFAPPRNYPIGDWAWAVKAGQLNQDDHIDLAVSAFRDHTVTVLHGVGDGTLVPWKVIPVDPYPSSLAIADGRSASDHDLDGDLLADLVVGFDAGSDVAVFHGDAEGAFPIELQHGTAQGPNGVAIADVNPDQDHAGLDILTANQGEAENDGTVSVLVNGSSGTFRAAQNHPAGKVPSSLVAGDFNGDRRVDVAVSNLNGGLNVLLGHGQGTFSPPVDWAYGLNGYEIATGDFNCDGRVDLVAANGGYDGSVVMLGNGDGTFRGAMSPPAGPGNAFGVDVADFDGDGWLDLVVVGQLPVDRGVTVYRGHGDGTFEVALELQAGRISERVEVADFDDDGRPDLAVTNRGSDDVSILLNRSTPNP